MLPTTAITLYKKEITDVFGAVVFEFLNPGFKRGKGLSSGDIIDNDGNPTISVIDFGDGFVLLLTGSVPDLELDFFLFERLNFLEVYSSKGRLKVLVETVLDIANG